MADTERAPGEAPGRAEDRAMAAQPSLAAYLPRLLLYPLRGNALGFVAVFAVILYFSFGAGAFGWWALLIFGAWTASYVFTCTERTAMGQALPPIMETQQLNPFDGRLAAALVYVAVLVGIPLVAGVYLGGAVQLLLGAVLALGLPAHLVLVGALGQPLAALDPAALVRTATALGWNGVLAAGVAAAASLVAGGALPGGMMAGIATALYGLVLTGHAAGFAAFHAADRVGLEGPAIDNDDAAAERELDGLVEAMLTYDGRGEREQALACWRAPREWVGSGEPLAIQVNAFRRVHANDRRGLARACGREVLARLLDRGRTVQAAELLDEVRELGPSRLAADAHYQRALAEAAAGIGRPELGLEVLGDLAEGEHDPGSARGALVKARLLAEQGREAEARELAGRLRRAVGTPLDPELERLEHLLRRLAPGG